MHTLQWLTNAVISYQRQLLILQLLQLQIILALDRFLLESLQVTNACTVHYILFLCYLFSAYVLHLNVTRMMVVIVMTEVERSTKQLLNITE